MANRYYGAMDPPRFPNKLAIMGVSFILIGGVLLLWTAGYLQRLAVLWPIAPVLIGLVLLYVRLARSGPDYYIFLGTSLLLTGLLLLLTGTVAPIALARIWPVFLTVIGVALLFYGFRKSKASRVTLTIPGGAMVLLSALFLPFSLDLVTADFAESVAVWWPILLVIVGLALIIMHLRRQKGL
jgi:hypothetical protein